VEGLDFAEFHLDKLSQLLQFNCNECNVFVMNFLTSLMVPDFMIINREGK